MPCAVSVTAMTTQIQFTFIVTASIERPPALIIAETLYGSKEQKAKTRRVKAGPPSGSRSCIFDLCCHGFATSLNCSWYSGGSFEALATFAGTLLPWLAVATLVSFVAGRAEDDLRCAAGSGAIPAFGDVIGSGPPAPFKLSAVDLLLIYDLDISGVQIALRLPKPLVMIYADLLTHSAIIVHPGFTMQCFYSSNSAPKEACALLRVSFPFLKPKRNERFRFVEMT